MEYDYERLIGRALQKPGFTSFIDPNDKIFMNPVNMGAAIEEYLKTSGQEVPPSATGIVRLILESLAFKYRQILDQLKQICPHPVEKIHIIGGGARNYLLNQFTVNATGLMVFAGPYESTAIGNLMVQTMADGTVSDLKQGRVIIKPLVCCRAFISSPRCRSAFSSATLMFHFGWLSAHIWGGRWLQSRGPFSVMVKAYCKALLNSLTLPGKG